MIGKAWMMAAVLVAALPAAAQEVPQALREKTKVEGLLKGRTLEGTYLRTGSPYRLVFGADGGLVNQEGAQGRWWVDDQGQYCREWTSGALQGNRACLGVAQAVDGGIAFLHEGRKVAEGRLR
ncbi:MAG: hypothetical protein H7841_06390 [Magnetospirillum sp. WYHS-4]